MRKSNWVTLLMGCLLLGHVAAMTIGVGIDWRSGIFVQEYWQEGKPRYLIANLGGEAARVTVLSYQMPDMREGPKTAPLPREPETVLAGPWDVPAGAVGDFDAAPLLGGQLVQFRAGEKRLGLLNGPKGPVAPPGAKIVTCHGLNGSGGRQSSLWLEQDAPSFKAGGDIELRLVSAANQGSVSFRKGARPAGFTSQPAELLFQDARCDSLPVRSIDDAVAIDTDKTLKEQPLHTVVLRFKAPDVRSRTMFLLSGEVRHRYGSFALSRGIVVEPPQPGK